jgi:hypothetical protein
VHHSISKVGAVTLSAAKRDSLPVKADEIVLESPSRDPRRRTPAGERQNDLIRFRVACATETMTMTGLRKFHPALAGCL